MPNFLSKLVNASSSSPNLGLEAHAGKYFIFDTIFKGWLSRNNLTESDLQNDLSPQFKGLPYVVPVPIIVMDPSEEPGSEVKLRIIKTEWYGTILPPNPKRYLIYPLESGRLGECLIIDSEQDYNHSSMNGVTLWRGFLYSDRIVLGERLFALPNSDDVERMLSCYLQLNQISRIQVLDMREAKPQD